jgi:hypothetical protein
MNKTRARRQARDIASLGLSVADLAATKGWTLDRELLTVLAADRVEELLAIAEKSQPSGPAAQRASRSAMNTWCWAATNARNSLVTAPASSSSPTLASALNRMFS